MRQDSVTDWRQLMIEELRRRNFAETTIRSYVNRVEHLCENTHIHPDQLCVEDIREYLAKHFRKMK